jgi:hypothetical protein
MSIGASSRGTVTTGSTAPAAGSMHPGLGGELVSGERLAPLGCTSALLSGDPGAGVKANTVGVSSSHVSRWKGGIGPRS